MLETTWFVLWGVLWGLYLILGGFDLGMGATMFYTARTDTERRTVFNAMGPFWHGNLTWLVTAGGVTFAAFPTVYATLFSGFYTALLLLLFSLILRGVAFEFRRKVDSEQWRGLWDLVQTVCSFLPCLLLGVAFANIFMGVPIDENHVFHGSVFTLLNPYGLAGGVLFVLMLSVHGALWLAVKTEGVVHDRAMLLASRLWILYVVWAVLFVAATAVATEIFANMGHYPYLTAILVLGVACLILVRPFIAGGKAFAAWCASSLAILCITLFGVLGIYPVLLPSTLNPDYSLTIANGASSPLTLTIMLVVALVFVPIVVAYQLWSFTLFKDKVGEKDLAYEEAY